MKTIIPYLYSSLSYSIKTKLFRKKTPFIAGLVLNDSCNLNCKHCSVNNVEPTSLSYKGVKKALFELHSLGIRSVAITGGEPFLWNDGNYSINDVVKLTRETGFKVSSIYTNGTFPINISCDVIFVSMDGTKEYTEKLRGNIFDTVIANIENSHHPKIYINFTINKLNKDNIISFLDFIKTVKQIKGIFFYFHTPYYGKDELFLSKEEKNELAKKIINLKKDYKILNSKSALIDYINNNWEKPSDICYVYSNKQEIFKCCREVDNKFACENCGYLGYLEVINITKLKPSAIFEALNYLPSSKARKSYDN